MKCWIALRCPHGELENLGAVFTNEDEGKEWCNKINKEYGYNDSPTYEWYLEETTLEANSH